MRSPSGGSGPGGGGSGGGGSAASRSPQSPKARTPVKATKSDAADGPRNPLQDLDAHVRQVSATAPRPAKAKPGQSLKH